MAAESATALSDHEQEAFERGQQLVWKIFNADPARAYTSPAEMFTGRHRGRSGKIKLKQTSARESLRIHASESVKAQFSRPPIDARYRGGRHFAVINALPSHQIALLRAIYQPASPVQFDHSVQLARELYGHYIESTEKKLRAATREIIRRMVDARISSERDWRLGIALSHRPWELFECSEDSWRKYREPHWRGICRLFDAMHYESVMAVYQKC